MSDGGFGGRRREPVEVRLPEHGLYVLESHHSAEFRMEAGQWPFHKLCWVSLGRGELERGSERVGLDRNCFLWLPAGSRHRFVDDPQAPMTLVIVCVDAALVDGDGGFGEAARELGEGRSCGGALVGRTAFHEARVVDGFRRALWEQSAGKRGWRVMLSGVVRELAASLLRGAGPAGERASAPGEEIDGLLAELDARFYEAISLREAAERCGYSARRFSDLFKERTGLTLVAYLNRKRVAYAKERLLETGHVAYACYESGFQDLAYFYRVFRRHEGLPPKAWLDRTRREGRPGG